MKKSVYGLKTAGNSWRQTLAEVLHRMEYLPNRADPDLYTKEATKSNGEKYYEYILVYVDDILCVSENPMRLMTALQGAYDLKGSIQKPINTLGRTLAPGSSSSGTQLGVHQV